MLYFFVLLLMPVVDTVLIRAQRRQGHPHRVVDRRSLFVLWFFLAAGLVAAAGLRTITAGWIQLARPLLAAVAVALMLLGMLLRWAAMITLGRFFSAHVEIAAEQPLVTTGLYRHVRHPAYAGIILVAIGIGVTYENWISLLAVTAMVVLGVANRVRIEEKALREYYGAAYEAYYRSTKRFLPFIL